VSPNSEQALASSNTNYILGKGSLVNKWRRQIEHSAVRASINVRENEWFIKLILISCWELLLDIHLIYKQFGSLLYLHLQTIAIKQVKVR
jgi:hypothetical protein